MTDESTPAPRRLPTDRRWTLKERNAIAILYSIDPALAVIACRKGPAHVLAGVLAGGEGEDESP